MFIVLKRKAFIVTGAFILLLTAAVLITARGGGEYVSGDNVISPCIIVDAGHGGKDSGASAADGTEEKNLNLELSKKLNLILPLFGYDVIMTRETDDSTDGGDRFIKRKDIAKRLELMEKRSDSVFVSIHMNKFPESQYWGAQTFYSKNNENSKPLALSVQNSIKTNIQPDNKREIKPSPNDVYLLKKAKIPAIIVECGFLSNTNELSLLKTDDYRSKLAFAITLGILDYNLNIS